MAKLLNRHQICKIPAEEGCIKLMLIGGDGGR
jgi:hypothetical protein